jgi:predicted 3-demethylubiquinone-9 3-methyltransferase (glyoxalase superfamily)
MSVTPTKQKITPYLWFDMNAEEAVNFYVSVFKDTRIIATSRYPDEMPDFGGKVLTIQFELFGQAFMALNGGPQFKFNEAVSFLVDCKDQAEVDYYWEKLTADGGEEGMCGWLKDKYGLSWQIIPMRLEELIGSSDKKKAGRAMQTMLSMRKIDVAELERAFNGE